MTETPENSPHSTARELDALDARRRARRMRRRSSGTRLGAGSLGLLVIAVVAAGWSMVVDWQRRSALENRVSDLAERVDALQAQIVGATTSGREMSDDLEQVDAAFRRLVISEIEPLQAQILEALTRSTQAEAEVERLSANPPVTLMGRDAILFAEKAFSSIRARLERLEAAGTTGPADREPEPQGKTGLGPALAGPAARGP